MNPGIYAGLPMSEYLAIPALSGGVLTTLVQDCAKLARHEFLQSIARDPEAEASPEEPEDKEDKEAMDRGSIAHSIFLENSMDNVEVIDPKDYPNLTKTDGEYKTPTGWTNKPIKQARARAYLAGKVPVLLSKMAQINAMVDETWAFVETLKTKQPLVWAMFQPDGESQS